MAMPRPYDADLKLLMTRRGELRIFHKGEPLPGVIKIECAAECRQKSTVTVTFIGLAVELDTEGPPDEKAEQRG